MQALFALDHTVFTDDVRIAKRSRGLGKWFLRAFHWLLPLVASWLAASVPALRAGRVGAVSTSAHSDLRNVSGS